ncbi:hypothetical protein [Dactylosporangium sp. NPDC005555]|uniref:bestrophin-like domain n=1 Tax=Dactylosporangium sp. NPDC005555 TaxID=3154889 RepID=UPI00339E4156
MAVAIAAGLAVQRFVPVEDRQENNDVAGIAFAIIGVLYAILMTFVIVSVWEAGDVAQDSGRAEARAVVDLNHYADTLPAAESATMRELTGQYVRIALLAAMSALMLFAVYELEFPFQCGESVTVDVFTDVVDDGTAR